MKEEIKMADTDKAAPAEATTPTAVQNPEIYTAQEFAQAANKIFGPGVRDYTVLAAFQYARKERATKAEAVKIVHLTQKKMVLII
jgi:hypothetical protein